MANVDVGPRNKMYWWHRSTQQILLDFKENGKKLSDKRPASIYMVPSSLRDLSPSSFKPQVVSIGPLHTEDKILQEFEEQKKAHLHNLLERLNIQPGIILDECLQKVNASIPKIRECYGGIITCNDDELAKMMVMDACFILDFLFLSEEHRRLTSRNAILTHSIFRDLVLLENQIPFFVLQDIFNCTISTIHPRPLTSGVLEHLGFLIPFKVSKENNYVIDITPQPDHFLEQPHHILGLLQIYFHPKNRILPACPPLKVPNHSALELDQAGVKFKPNSNVDGNHWPLAINFSSSSSKHFRWCWGNRTLRMPKLNIDDNTELFLRNIIAYEQCTPNVPDYITSYTCAIDMLIDTKEDVSKLVESEVLSNHLGSNKDATKMLNNISKQFVFDEFYYNRQWEQLHEYYDGYVPKNIALLKRTYFSSPWSIIAFIVAIIVFALTITQTILRIIKY